MIVINADCVVLTYDAIHRKTYDVLCLLKASGYNNVIVWAVPMHYKKSFRPIYEHRPPVVNMIKTEDLCKNFGYKYIVSYNGYNEIPVDSTIPILVCGAGIMPEDFVKNHFVINAHPGYIPLARGLDALKWEIIEGLPIGVTTHRIGDEIDAGEILERKEIPVYKNDTFHALAQRVYDNEVLMLVGALKRLNCEHFYEPAGNNCLHKRMESDIERNLLICFEQLIKEKGM